MVLSACDYPKKDKGNFGARDIEFSGCLEVFKDMKTSVDVSEGYLEVTHKFFPMNCGGSGALITPQIDTKENLIEIDVNIISDKDSLDCECTTDISYRVGPIKQKGTYDVVIRGRKGEIYKGEITY